MRQLTDIHFWIGATNVISKLKASMIYAIVAADDFLSR